MQKKERKGKKWDSFQGGPQYTTACTAHSSRLIIICRLRRNIFALIRTILSSFSFLFAVCFSYLFNCIIHLYSTHFILFPTLPNFLSSSTFIFLLVSPHDRTAHGPDNATFRKAADPLSTQIPVYQNAGMAFMFESTYLLKIAPQGMDSPTLQDGYSQCWEDLPKIFNGHINPYNV